MTDKNRPFAQAPVSRFRDNVIGSYEAKPITRFIVILENNQLRFGQ